MTLALAFEARSTTGTVSVAVQPNEASEARGFPVCEATVTSGLTGYDALLGWVQLVGTVGPPSPPRPPERRFEIDPLQLFDGIDLPFAFFGIHPTLYDAPSRRDRDQTLDWLAHSFLCLPDTPMARTVRPVAAFSWGFRLHAGTITIVPAIPLPLSTWTTHRPLLHRSFPTWRFDALPP